MQRQLVSTGQIHPKLSQTTVRKSPKGPATAGIVQELFSYCRIVPLNHLISSPRTRAPISPWWDAITLIWVRERDEGNRNIFLVRRYSNVRIGNPKASVGVTLLSRHALRA